MRKNNLRCYDNYVSATRGMEYRCPGVHFVTREWWDATRAAREKYGKELMEHGAQGFDHDEWMLGKIIEESGLPRPPATPNLWAHHGLHLGDFRRRIQNREKHFRFEAIQGNYVRKLLADEEFMALVGQCAPHLQGLKETFDIFQKSTG
jgi:hypothetical protein